MTNSNEKGKRNERDACIVLRPIFPDARRRVVNHEGVEDGVDLDNTGPFGIQVKGYREYTPAGVIEEVTRPGVTPMAMIRAYRRPWVTVMYRSDFDALVIPDITGTSPVYSYKKYCPVKYANKLHNIYLVSEAIGKRPVVMMPTRLFIRWYKRIQ